MRSLLRSPLRASTLGVGASLAVGFGWACLHREATADPPANTAPPTTALVLATAHDEAASSTDVRRVELRADGMRSTTLATIRHPAGAVVRGDAEHGRIAVVADDPRARGDWGAALYRVTDHGATALLDRVGHARKPLVGDDGRIYVERGSTGPEPSAADGAAGHLREDPIEISAIDDAGTVQSVYSANAYALHLAGELDRELVVYRVRFGGADLVAIDRSTGRSRLVTPLAPFARDFSIDRGRRSVVFSNRDGARVDRWITVRVDLATGQSTELHAEEGTAPAPFALGSGDVAFTALGRGGLSFDRGPSVEVLGPGFDAVQAESVDGAWLLVAHVPASGYDETVAFARADQRVLRLTTRDERIDAIGFERGGEVVR